MSLPRQSGEYCYEQGLDKDLKPDLMQVKNYAGPLENLPVLVVCNRERIEIHPCFAGYPSTPRIIPLEDIGLPEHLQALRWLFSEGGCLARVFLWRRGLSFSTIAAEAGFHDLSHVDHAFSEVFDISPTQGIDTRSVELINCEESSTDAGVAALV